MEVEDHKTCVLVFQVPFSLLRSLLCHPHNKCPCQARSLKSSATCPRGSTRRTEVITWCSTSLELDFAWDWQSSLFVEKRERISSSKHPQVATPCSQQANKKARYRIRGRVSSTRSDPMFYRLPVFSESDQVQVNFSASYWSKIWFWLPSRAGKKKGRSFSCCVYRWRTKRKAADRANASETRSRRGRKEGRKEDQAAGRASFHPSTTQ